MSRLAIVVQRCGRDVVGGSEGYAFQMGQALSRNHDVEILTTGSHTSGTVSIGFSTDANVDTFLTPHTFTHNLTRSSISLPGGGGYAGPTTTGVSVAFLGAFSGYQFVTAGTQVTVSVKLNNWISTMTTGTVKSIVRYT